MRDGLILGLAHRPRPGLSGDLLSGISATEKYVHVVVDRGMTFSQIAARFEESGLIRSDLVFKVLGRAFGIEHRAKAGRYRFRPTATLADILRALYKGATYREQIVVPPGRRAGADSGAAGQGRGRRLDGVREAWRGTPRSWPPSACPRRRADGYLFPETYDIEWREEAPSVLERMVTRPSSRSSTIPCRARAERGSASA